MRAFVEFSNGSFELGQGETTLGRSMACKVRFNDVAISRFHLRFSVDEERVTVEDCGTTNGSLLNGHRVASKLEIKNGDVLHVGSRTLHIKIVNDSSDGEDEEDTANHPDAWSTAGTVNADSPDEAATSTAPPSAKARSQTSAYWQRPTPGTAAGASASLRFLTCRQCRARAPVGVVECPVCGSPLRPVRAEAQTEPISVREERRKYQRIHVEIPVMYTSDTLCFEAMARDLSHGGLFLATELLDPVGTKCQLTALPEGFSAVVVGGRVCHVAERGDGTRPPGMGVEFVELSDEAKQWLSSRVV